ncbi:MAG: esterase [Chloroflexota bacterium]|nr:esterase [Chloroflexota bacterium]
MPALQTTLGPKRRDELGMILPHEHVFVDLRTHDQPGYAEADPAGVVRLMAGPIVEAMAAGVTAIVEPSTVGVGRRVDILLAVSRATGMPLVVPTGVYREPWVTPWAHGATVEELANWMTAEIETGIEDTGVRAGWVKVSAGDDGITPVEAKILRAAARASARTGAAIGSHTIRGQVVRDQLAILADESCPSDRFIWIHAQQEPDIAIHHDLARQGVWIEYDGIGDPADDDRYLVLVRAALQHGLGHRVLLSQDLGWYDPAEPGGGTPRPYTHLPIVFLDRLRAVGVDGTTVDALVRDNPFAAFAR